MKIYTAHPFVNIYLPPKFEVEKQRRYRGTNPSGKERKIKITIIKTRIEPVGEPYSEVCLQNGSVI